MKSNGFGMMPSAMQKSYQNDPRLAIALMAQKSGMSTAPVSSPLEGLARALQGGVGGYMEGKLQNEYQQQGEKTQADLTDAMMQAQKGVVPWVNPDTEQLAIQGAAPGSREALITALQSKDNPYLTNMASEQQMKMIDDKQKLDLMKQKMDLQLQMKLDPRYIEAQKAIRAAGRTVVNVNATQEKEEDKAIGKAFGNQYVDLQKAGLQAPSDIAKYERLDNLLDQVNTGKFTGTTTQLKAAAKGLGVDLNDLGVPDDVAPAEAARALSSQLSLELRNPAGGAGMPGAMSDADREFLASMVPNLETSPQGRKMMVEYKKRVSKRNMDVAKLARDYRSKRGMVDEGFYDVLGQYSSQNPLFTKEDYQKVQSAATPAAQSKGAGNRIRFDANGNMVR